jgi:cysteine desulfurase/selenocysteine lyase
VLLWSVVLAGILFCINKLLYPSSLLSVLAVAHPGIIYCEDGVQCSSCGWSNHMISYSVKRNLTAFRMKIQSNYLARLLLSICCIIGFYWTSVCSFQIQTLKTATASKRLMRQLQLYSTSVATNKAITFMNPGPLAVRTVSATPFDINDFPILQKELSPGKKITYLDSAASSHMPMAVKQSMNHYWDHCHSNVNRGSHRLSSCATEKYEGARKTVQKFINAASDKEIVFTGGATQAINLVAHSWGLQNIKAGDEILISLMEHHSNLIPWQMVAARTGAILKYVGLNSDNTLDMNDFQKKLTPRTKLVCIAHVSNVLGCENPLPTIITASHDVGAAVLVDACQSVAHMDVDVLSLDVDFLVASSHKMCGPTGIGFLYAKDRHLQSMPPLFVGGGVADAVDLYDTKFLPSPHRFEAGTPPIAEAVGLDAACNYLESIGIERISAHCRTLGQYMYDQLSNLPDIKVYGPSKRQSGIVSFSHTKVHPADLGAILDMDGICVRAGLHCAHPLHKALPFGDRGSVRASVYAYNSIEDVDMFIGKLIYAISYFHKRK